MEKYCLTVLPLTLRLTKLQQMKKTIHQFITIERCETVSIWCSELTGGQIQNAICTGAGASFQQNPRGCNPR